MKPITHCNRHLRPPELHHCRRVNRNQGALLALRIHRDRQQDPVILRPTTHLDLPQRLGSEGRWFVMGFQDQTRLCLGVDLDERVSEVAWLCGVYTIGVLIGFAGVLRVYSRQLDVVFPGSPRRKDLMAGLVTREPLARFCADTVVREGGNA